QRNSKPKILAAECDKICPAGKSGCCCHVKEELSTHPPKKGAFPKLFDPRPSKSRKLDLSRIS
ncbi:unnamed protein product, partial [Porites lobata]